MKHYSKIPVWETKRRIEQLRKFHMDVERYFLNSHTGVAGRARRQRDDRAQAAQDAKRSIYRALQAVNSSVHSAGINPEIFYHAVPFNN